LTETRLFAADHSTARVLVAEQHSLAKWAICLKTLDMPAVLKSVGRFWHTERSGKNSTRILSSA
jgi:hypothetical protein